MIYEVQKTYVPAKLPTQPLLNLETCIINFCTFPHAPNTCFHLDEEMAGFQAATVMALQLHRAFEYWKIFPSLKLCRVISSDWEPSNEELLDEYRNFWMNYWSQSFSYGIVQEVITHDVLAHHTHIAPFKCTGSAEGAYGHDAKRTKLSPPRMQKIYEWRDNDDAARLVSLEDIEPYVEGCWTVSADGTRQPSMLADHSSIVPGQMMPTPKFPYHHVEQYEGLLDRAQVREKRIENGQDFRHNTL